MRCGPQRIAMMDTQTYIELKSMIKKKPTHFSIFNKRENMLFVIRKKSSNCYLIDKANQTAIELVDINNNITAFSMDDIDKAVLEDKKYEEYRSSIEGMQTNIGLSISDFHDGVAGIKWMLEKGGYIPYDEEGYGFEEWPDVSIYGKIRKDGSIKMLELI